MPALTLYFAPGSSAMAPHIALHEIGAPFEGRPISFAKKEQLEPAFLALNPEGKVPTLLIDGRPLTEVAAILFYLAKSFPQAKLLPDGVEAEAQAVSWMSFAAATLHAARRRGGEAGRAAFALADKKLGRREWALGHYSIADIHLFRLYWRLRPLLQAAPETMPALEAHYARMMNRPAVKRTIEIESAIGYELP
jgi:glutathione S-transferase